MVFIVIFSVALILGGSLTHRDGDLAKHLRLGHTVIEQGQLPLVDDYSHTMRGVETVPYEWLAQTALALTERIFGFDGIGVLTAILAALPWAVMYRWLVRRGFSVWLSVALALLGAAASMIHWAARPHAFSWLFVALWVILLEDLRSGRRGQVWILVPLALLWVNLHGAFIVGYFLIGAHLIGALVDRFRSPSAPATHFSNHLILVLLATILASFVNPAGPGGVLQPFTHLLGDAYIFDFTREFTSPDFHNLFFWPFLAMILISVLLAFRWNTTTLLLTVSWTGMALYAFRNIPLYALVVTPILADAITAWTSDRRSLVPERSSRWREYSDIESHLLGGSLAVVVLAVIAFSMARSPGSSFEFSPEVFPIEAVQATVESPPGDRVFNQFIWGGYLVYCCQPEIPIFIDGRTDHYGPEFLSEYDQTIRGLPAWRDVFEAYAIDWVIISPNTGLAQVLIEASDWTESYRDTTTVIFVPSHRGS